MCTSVQINNPISRSEVIVMFSLLFFSQFLYSETLYRVELSVLHAREKQIGTSHVSCGLHFKQLWKMLNPAEIGRSLVLDFWMFCLRENFENTWRQKFWSTGINAFCFQFHLWHSAMLKLQHPFLTWAAWMQVHLLWWKCCQHKKEQKFVRNSFILEILQFYHKMIHFAVGRPPVGKKQLLYSVVFKLEANYFWV